MDGEAVQEHKRVNIEKLLNRFHQFGFLPSCVQMARAIARPMRQVNHYLILAVTDHQPDVLSKYSEVFEMKTEDVMAASKREDLDERQRKLLLRFLEDGCCGFALMAKDRLAGYAFVQPAGTYIFGGSGRFQVPEKMMMLKNLFVFPDFRGHALGKKLNQARLASIPAEHTPIVFVIPENRFAIRNLKMYGFEEIMIVTRKSWFKKWTIHSIRILNDCHISDCLIRGFECTEKNKRKSGGR
jgi:GNAT superfamily N-acetyltransferase